MKPRLQEEYENKIIKQMKDTFGYNNPHEVPKLEKIVLNMGCGDASNDRGILNEAVEAMTLIAGQKAVITKARKSNASFKIRDGMNIGCKVTLRGKKMYEFLDRLVTIAMPRIRDFRGINGKSFDGNGNYAMGIKEHIIFPEINYDKVNKIRGMDIIVCTSAKNDNEAKELLTHFRFPFKDKNQQG